MVAESLRILILEDNPADAELVQFELQEAGFVFTPKVVMTEEDFVRQLQEFSPDLILSDYDLPKYNGAVALAEARRRCPDTPFILVTGAVTEDRAIDILTQGAKDYVLKNRLNQRLVPAVKRALAEAEEHRARKQAEEDLRKAHRALESLVGKRTAELHAVLDTAPVAIWIAHDPECKVITGNAYADEIIMKTSRLGNISRSAAPGEVEVFYRVFHYGVELKPEEMPAQVATATGKPVTDMEVELVFSDSRQVHLIESAVPLFDPDGRVRGAVITGSDVSQIKQSEREKSLILENANEIIAYHDAEQKLVWANQAYLVATGLPLSGLRSKKCYICWGLGQVCVDCPVSDAIRTGEPQSAELTPQNQPHWPADQGSWLVKAAPVKDSTGKVIGAIEIAHDITARKQAERELRESEARLRRFYDSPLMGVIYWNMDGKIIDANDKFLEMVGYTREDLTANRIDWVNMTPPEYRHLDEASVKELKATGVNEAPFEKEYIRKDGSRLPILVAGAMLDETRLNGVAFVIDITKRKQAEAEMTRLASFPMLNPSPILEVDFAGVIHFSNPAAERLFPDLLERKLEHPFLADWEATARIFCAEGLLENRRELNIHGRWYMQTLSLVEEPRRIRIYAHDITLRKEAEKELMKRAAELEDVNQDLESFSYSVSHDLRAPLRAITGYLQMILKSQVEQFDEETRRRFQMITDNAEKMGLLIEELLAFSRLGSQDVAKTSLNMAELAGEVWQELITIHPCREMTLRIGPMPAACGDKTLIRQVYGNLLGNAVKFTQGRNPAVVEAGSCIKDGEAVYYVRDNGIGFDTRFHDRLFGVFQRLHSDEEYKGTGIGLALVKRIINRHGGRVWAEGEVDKGATFYFTLPTSQE